MKLLSVVLFIQAIFGYRVDINRRSDRSFAAITSINSVITWGDSFAGGNSSSVSMELSGGVVQVSSTQYAFACVKENGDVYSWGDPSYGGDLSSIAHLVTSNVARIFSTSAAFAALKNNGGVVTW
jgi:hypothetical protein